VADAIAPATDAVGSKASEALSLLAGAASGTLNAITATINVCPVTGKVVSGSLATGFVTLELKKRTRVGGVLIGNRANPDKKSKEPAFTGTKDLEVQVSEDGKVWSTVYKGFLFPGAPFKGSQYLTFAGKWANFVRVRTLSGYQGGAGLDSLRVFSPIGAAGAMWLWNGADVIHSYFDLHWPEMWGSIEVPEAETFTELAMRVPLAISRFLGFHTPDDLGLHDLETRLEGLKTGTSKVGTKVWYKAAEAISLSSAAGVRAAKLSALGVVNATSAVGRGGKAAGKLALRGTTKGVNATAAATRMISASVGRGSGKVWAAFKKGAAKAKTSLLGDVVPLPAKPEFNIFGTFVPLTLLAGAAGATLYPSEFKQLQSTVKDKVVEIKKVVVGEDKTKKKKAWKWG